MPDFNFPDKFEYYCVSARGSALPCPPAGSFAFSHAGNGKSYGPPVGIRVMDSGRSVRLPLVGWCLVPGVWPAHPLRSQTCWLLIYRAGKAIWQECFFCGGKLARSASDLPALPSIWALLRAFYGKLWPSRRAFPRWVGLRHLGKCSKRISEADRFALQTADAEVGCLCAPAAGFDRIKQHSDPASATSSLSESFSPPCGCEH